MLLAWGPRNGARSSRTIRARPGQRWAGSLEVVHRLERTARRRMALAGSAHRIARRATIDAAQQPEGIVITKLGRQRIRGGVLVGDEPGKARKRS